MIIYKFNWSILQQPALSNWRQPALIWAFTIPCQRLCHSPMLSTKMPVWLNIEICFLLLSINVQISCISYSVKDYEFLPVFCSISFISSPASQLIVIEHTYRWHRLQSLNRACQSWNSKFAPGIISSCWPYFIPTQSMHIHYPYWNYVGNSFQYYSW